MRPVATRCRWKNLLLAAFQLPLGLGALVVALWLVPEFVATEVVGREGGSWGMLLLGLIPLLIGWLSVASGARCALAAFDKDCRLSAGPEGVSFRVPGPGLRRTAYLTYAVLDRTLPWEQIRSWRQFVRRANGVPVSNALILETDDETFVLEGIHFSEPLEKIAAAITSAAGR